MKKNNNQFRYDKLKNLIIPDLQYSQKKYEDCLKLHVSDNCRWLDLGCGHQLLPHWRKDEEINIINKSQILVGIDFEMDSLTKHENIKKKIRGNISNLPFRNHTFDIITANMVVEHLEHPEKQFSEVSELLRPDGKFIFHTPNIFGYSIIWTRWLPEKVKKKLAFILENRKEEDVFKTFYQANSKSKILDIAKKSGFELHDFKFILSTPHFKNIPILLFFELIILRILKFKLLKKYRPNIICVLSKVN